MYKFGLYFFGSVLVVLEPKNMLKCYDYLTIVIVFFLIFLLAKDICFMCVIFTVFYFGGG